MTKAEEQAIISTLSTAGWKIIEEMLNEEIKKGVSTTKIDAKTLSNEQIASQVVGANIASEIISSFVGKLYQVKNNQGGTVKKYT